MIHKIVLEVETEDTLTVKELICLFEEMFADTEEIEGESIIVHTIEEYTEGEVDDSKE